MPLKAPRLAPTVGYNWTGFYIGGNAGYSWGRSDTTFTSGGVPAPFSSSQNLDGWLGGGQIGYNWQGPNSRWVVGLEADLQGTGQRGTFNAPAVVTGGGGGVAPIPFTTTTGSLAQKLPWFGTVRARLGFTPTDRWLLYVTGGLAYGEVDSTGTITATTGFAGLPPIFAATASSSVNTTRTGWTIGGGAEWAIVDRWTAKVEYLYMDLGTFSSTFAYAAPLPSVGISSRVTDNIFRVGLNYHFSGPTGGGY
jgi:outer membrane immunogenic protein